MYVLSRNRVQEDRMKTVIQEKMLNNIAHFISLTKYPDKYLSYFLSWRTGSALTCRFFRAGSRTWLYLAFEFYLRCDFSNEQAGLFVKRSKCAQLLLFFHWVWIFIYKLVIQNTKFF